MDDNFSPRVKDVITYAATIQAGDMRGTSDKYFIGKNKNYYKTIIDEISSSN